MLPQFILLEAGQPMANQHEYTHRHGDSRCIIHAVQAQAATVHDLKPAPELLHGEKSVGYEGASHQRIARGLELAERNVDLFTQFTPLLMTFKRHSEDGHL